MEYSDTPQWTAYLQLMEERPSAFAPSPALDIVTDAAEAARFTARTGIQIGVLYRSPYRILVVDLVRDPEGRHFAYERLLPAVPADGVVAVTMRKGKFILLRQFRHPLRAEQYAFPRGFGEPGLSPEETVRKEVAEELRTPVRSLRFLGRLAADSGLFGGYASVYLCQVDRTDITPGYEEILDVVELSPQELEGWIAAGTITDSFTISAYGLYRLGAPSP